MNFGDFMAASEIEYITGYKYAADQRRWLTKQGIPFIQDRFGKPKVSRVTVQSMLTPEGATTRVEPNWEAIG